MIPIKRLDHFVLNVVSVEDTAAFYARVLGFEIDRSREGRLSLRQGDIRINLQDEDHAPPQRAGTPTPGALDFCYEIQGGLEDAVAHLEAEGIRIEKGPVTRNGSKGPMTSVYFRDPDQNLVELSVYP